MRFFISMMWKGCLGFIRSMYLNNWTWFLCIQKSMQSSFLRRRCGVRAAFEVLRGSTFYNNPIDIPRYVFRKLALINWEIWRLSFLSNRIGGSLALAFATLHPISSHGWEDSLTNSIINTADFSSIFDQTVTASLVMSLDQEARQRWLGFERGTFFPV